MISTSNPTCDVIFNILPVCWGLPAASKPVQPRFLWPRKRYHRQQQQKMWVKLRAEEENNTGCVIVWQYCEKKTYCYINIWRTYHLGATMTQNTSTYRWFSTPAKAVHFPQNKRSFCFFFCLWYDLKVFIVCCVFGATIFNFLRTRIQKKKINSFLRSNHKQ